MAEVAKIQIEVDARQAKPATRALNALGVEANEVGKQTSRMGREMKQAERQTERLSRTSMKLRRMLGLLSAGLGGLTFVGLARGVERATTQLANIEATMRVAAGSASAAGRQIEFIRNESERLGLFFPTVAKQMAQFSAAARGTSITSRELRTIFTGIAEASRAMGLTAPEAEGAMKALQQMMSKGKVSAEELRQQLGERMPGSIQIMAASLDVTTQKLFEMMENGRLLSDEVLPKFGRELQDVFSAQARLQSARIAASIQRLQTAFFDLMAQGNLFGAAEAINRLSESISEPSFQKSFDRVVQGLSELALIIGENIDKIITLTKVLAVIGIASFTKKIFGAVAALFDMSDAAKASTAVISGFAGRMTFLSKTLSFLGGPAGIIAGVVSSIFFFSQRSDTAKESTQRWSDELGYLADQMQRVRMENISNRLDEMQPGLDAYIEKVRAVANAERFLEQRRERNASQQVLENTRERIKILKDQANAMRALVRRYGAEKAELDAIIEALEERRDLGVEAANAQDNLSESMAALAEIDPVIAAQLRLKESLSTAKSAFEDAGLSIQQQERILADIREEYAESIHSYFGVSKANEDLSKSYEELRASVDPAFESAVKYRDVILELKDALDKGNITQDQYVQLVKKAAESMGDFSDEGSKTADKIEEDFNRVADSIEGEFSDAFYNIFDDGLNAFDDLADGILDIFKRTLADSSGSHVSKCTLEDV